MKNIRMLKSVGFMNFTGDEDAEYELDDKFADYLIENHFAVEIDTFETATAKPDYEKAVRQRNKRNKP